ncbi:MAG: hypothetical protein E7321_02595 [Clostridiales bacterium]|nr:hypothetical protein [Clostridiales bacterium]
MSSFRKNPAKIFVKVRADHLIGGGVRPLMLRTEDGPAMRIDRVTDVREAPSLKAGGQGLRYTCMIEDRRLYLFYDDPHWFIEADD